MARMRNSRQDVARLAIEIAGRAASPRPGRAFDDGLTALAVCYFTGLLAAAAFSFGFYYLDRASYGVSTGSDILDAVAIFDGRWYRQIAVDGYSYDPGRRSNVAFFPMYPVLGRGLILITGMRAEAALLVVSNLSLLAALWLLACYVRTRFPDAGAHVVDCTLLAAAVFPTGCFLRLAYSESTFLLLAIFAMLAMARSWPPWRAALIVGLATAARPVGVGAAGAAGDPPVAHRGRRRPVDADAAHDAARPVPAGGRLGPVGVHGLSIYRVRRSAGVRQDPAPLGRHAGTAPCLKSCVRWRASRPFARFMTRLRRHSGAPRTRTASLGSACNSRTRFSWLGRSRS